MNDRAHHRQTRAPENPATLERCRLALHGAKIGLFDWDLRTNEVYLSAEWKRQVGYQDQEIASDLDEWERRVHPDDLPVVSRTVRAFLAQPWPDQPLEFRFRHKNGSYRWMLIQASVQVDAEGRPLRIFGSHADITERKRAELALRESEQAYRSLVETSRDLTWSLDAECRLTFVNAAARAIYGYEPAEMLGRPFTDFESAEQARKDLVVLARIQAGAQSLNYETIHLRKDGTPVWLNFNAVVLRDGQGAVLGSMGTAQDITEKKLAEEALRERERELRLITNNLSGPVSRVNRELRYLFVNDQYERVFGKARAEVVGHTMPEVIGAELFRHVEPYVRRVLTGERVTFETQVHVPTGTEDARVTFVPDLDPNREVIGFFVLAFDITARRQAEAALRESDRRLKTLISNLPGCVYRMTGNPDLPPDFISEGVVRLTGFTQHEYLLDRTVTWNAGIHPDDREAVSAIVQSSLAAREPYESEYRIRTKSGETKWVWERGGGHFSASGDLTALEGFITDITARKQLEEQLRQVQKLEAVGQLAGGVAHDFNNVLSVIQGHLSMLELDCDLTVAARDSIGEIRQAADRAANLTRQLLTFSRRQTRRPCRLDLNDVVKNMARMLQRILGEDIAMVLDLLPGALVVSADAGMMEQVLLNLAVNSRDAMPRGGQLRVETSMVDLDSAAIARMPQARAGAFVCLTTSDTGTGIPAQVLPRIFEPFFSTKELGRGTGLGLATVYGIVQQHEGWILVDSELGVGTTFRVYLPRQSGRILEAPRRWTPIASPGGHETILFVEDEPALRALIGNLLSRRGYRVLVAASGPEALEQWRAHASEVNLLLTDLVMPDGMSGFDLGARLAGEVPWLRVIYTSGYSPEIAGRGQALVAGVNFLAKPFDPDLLLCTVRAALDRRESR
jgi:two-component system, cell cycle sensor histidine kinase and response regulator CckA